MDPGGRPGRRPIGLPLVILQMAVSAIAFVFVLGAVALALPLWQLGKRLVRSQRTMRGNAVTPVLAIDLGDDMRRDKRNAYCRLLHHILAKEVQSSFQAQYERPTQRIRELLQQIDQETPRFQLFSR